MTSQDDPHIYFSNISRSVITKPSVMHASGNIYLNSDSKLYALRLLLANSSTGAFHDAAERADPPRCHPHTRMAIRAEIMEWVQTPGAMRKLMLWMSGPAGSGKTSIAQSIAEECKRRGLLTASFFFGRAVAGRNDTTLFVATIAYQLSRSIPEISDNILSAIEKEPAIFSLALDVQMQVLLIEPLKSLPPLSKPIFVITDGADECGPQRESHTTLLNALGTAISELRHIPLIFLIASRPEYEIREAFNGKLLSPLVKSLVLDQDYKPDDDIRLYLNSIFQEIRDKHSRLGSRFPSPWPTKSDVELLVSKASGQFIFASTITKFIGSPRYHPPNRLDIILGLSAPGNETPFAQLDALYRFILSSVADLPRVLEILTFLILANYESEDWSLEPTAEVLEAFLGFAIGPVLVDMHALVFIPSVRHSTLRIHHASLYDFLTDRSRSHDYYIDITQGHITLSRCWLKIMTNYPHLPAPLSLLDCVNGFVAHCRNITTTTSSELAGDLASFSLKKLLNKIRGYDDLYQSPWDDFFLFAQRHVLTWTNVFPRLRDEFDAFVLERLSQYPPALHTLIPIMIVYHRGLRTPHLLENSLVPDIFRVSFYALNPSEVEVADGLRLDSTLLHLYNTGAYNFASRNGFSTLFKDRSRAGKFFVDNGRYVTLAKQIVKAICPMPGKEKHRVEFVQHGVCRSAFNSDSPHPTIHIPIATIGHYGLMGIIFDASADLELAVLLRERVLQYDDKVFADERRRLAQSSLQYIRRCGIPYLQHMHRPNTNKCVVCENCDDASVVFSMPTPPRPGATFFSSLRRSIRDRLGFLTRP